MTAPRITAGRASRGGRPSRGAPRGPETAIPTGGGPLKGLLPPDLVLPGDKCAPEDFTPRRSATCKTYRYSIWNAPFPSALERHCVLHIPDPLDVASMLEGATSFVGEHDFSAF